MTNSDQGSLFAVLELSADTALHAPNPRNSVDFERTTVVFRDMKYRKRKGKPNSFPWETRSFPVFFLFPVVHFYVILDDFWAW